MINEIKEKFVKDKYFYILLSLFIFIGIALRLYVYLQQYSFDMDEVALAISILKKNTYSELIFTKLLAQTHTPYGFLIFSKLLVSLFGISEMVFRAIPLLSGIGSIFLFYFFAKKYLSGQSLLLAVFLFSVSPKLIQYSNMFKQYSTDVLFALILFVTAEHFLNRDKVKILIPALVGAVSVYFSLTSVFILASIGIYYGFNFLVKNKKENFFRVLIISFIWLIFFVLNYCLIKKYSSSPEADAYLMNFWEKGFMPLPFDLIWTLSALFLACSNLFVVTNFVNVAIYALLTTIGLIIFIIKEKEKSLLLFLPVILAMIASVLRLYPFADRLILFLVPVFIIFVSKTLDIIEIFNLKPFLKIILSVIFSLLVLAQISLTPETIHFRTNDRMGDIFGFLKENIQENDYIYTRFSEGQVLYYYNNYQYKFSKNIYFGSSYLGADDFNIFIVPLSKKIQFFKHDINELKNKSKKVWFVFYSNILPEEISFFKEYLTGRAKLVKSMVTPAGEAYLYEFRDTGNK